MKCVTCKHGVTFLGTTVITLEQEGTTVVFKDIPAQVCDLCGAYSLSVDTVEELRIKLNEAKAKGAELEIIRLKPAA